MAKRKLLIISYYFPPFGGAGSGRPYALFRELPRFEIDVDVLTVKQIASRSFDYSLLQKEDEKRIYRSRSFDPQRIMYLLGLRTVKNKIIGQGKPVSDRFFPDSKIGWVKQAVKLGRVLIENKKYDTILTTSPPISSHLVGKTLAKEFNVKWIADFRDYWTSYKPEEWYDTESHIKRANKLINEIKEKADYVTTVSDAIGNFLNTNHIILNSFNNEFAAQWKSPNKSDSFVIGLLGTIDKLTIAEPLLKLLVLLREKDENLFRKVKVLQVGQINDPEFMFRLDKNNLIEKFEIHNFQERKKAIELLNSSHMFYLGVNQKYEEGMLTSRVFEMIASGRSILCFATENSELGRLVNSTNNSQTFQSDSLDTGFFYLKEEIIKWKESNLKIIPVSDYAKEYSSSRMAEKFAEII